MPVAWCSAESEMCRSAFMRPFDRKRACLVRDELATDFENDQVRQLCRVTRHYPSREAANSRVPCFFWHSRYASRARTFVPSYLRPEPESRQEAQREWNEYFLQKYFFARRKNLQLLNEYMYLFFLSLHFLFKLSRFSSSSSSLHFSAHAARSVDNSEKSSRNSFLEQLFPSSLFSFL